jgi:hypothetical protein
MDPEEPFEALTEEEEILEFATSTQAIGSAARYVNSILEENESGLKAIIIEYKESEKTETPNHYLSLGTATAYATRQENFFQTKNENEALDEALELIEGENRHAFEFGYSNNENIIETTKPNQRYTGNTPNRFNQAIENISAYSTEQTQQKAQKATQHHQKAFKETKTAEQQIRKAKKEDPLKNMVIDKTKIEDAPKHIKTAQNRLEKARKYFSQIENQNNLNFLSNDINVCSANLNQTQARINRIASQI